ncbi:MAG: radical SAM protein [Thermotogae bacterium]|jgi:biotin synthase|nr:radical SAM protein [Thermotogota bacterium]MCL5032359.1 radical SAM protein [Thermotogota bacterium]
MRISYGSARFLNLISSGPLLDIKTVYTMFGERCVFDCAYCTQAKTSKSSTDMLSRIVWPVFDLERIVDALKNADGVKRICLQVVSTPSVEKEAFDFIQKVKTLNIPISVSVRITSFEMAKKWFDHSIERLGMATDVVDEKLYEIYRGGKFKNHVKLVKKIANNFPGLVTTHVIVGLGESERQMVEFIQEMYDSKVSVGLFAFTPIRGTKLENKSRPAFESYRRIQISHYLIKNGLSRVDDFEFSKDGEIIRYGFEPAGVPQSAFETSGCPNCTRPYYNEKPGETSYNLFKSKV